MSHISSERIAQIIADEKARKRARNLAAMHRVANKLDRKLSETAPKFTAEEIAKYN